MKGFIKFTAGGDEMRARWEDGAGRGVGGSKSRVPLLQVSCHFALVSICAVPGRHPGLNVTLSG